VATATALRRCRSSRHTSRGTVRHVYGSCECAGRLRRHTTRECQQRRLVLWVHVVVVVHVHVVEVRQRCLQQCRIKAQVHAHSRGGWCRLTCRRALRSDSSGRPRCRGNGRCNGRRTWCRHTSECLDARCECFGTLETLTSAVLVTCTRQQLRASLLGVELALEVIARRCRDRSLQRREKGHTQRQSETQRIAGGTQARALGRRVVTAASVWGVAAATAGGGREQRQ
jgi:hypothetical protein